MTIDLRASLYGSFKASSKKLTKGVLLRQLVQKNREEPKKKINTSREPKKNELLRLFPSMCTTQPHVP
jgi:hypothetical protein